MIIWHNPGCGTARKVMEALKARGITPQVRLYLKDPPSAAELRAVLAQAKMTARDLLRTREPEARDIADDAGEAAIIACGRG